MGDIILLDGGMGQELTHRSKEAAHPQWGARVMMNEPDLVQSVHEEYLRAGAKVITLNTYSSTPTRLENFGNPEQFKPLQQRGIDLASAARDRVDQDARLAGCLPPLVGSYHPELLPGYDTLLAEYRRIAEVEAPHVDLFLCETMSKAEEARAAAVAATETGKPVWVAWSLNEQLDDNGKPRLRSGETIAQALSALEGLPVEAILFNCCPPEAIAAGLADLATDGRPFGGYANGFQPIPQQFVLGETVDILQARTDLDPTAYAERVVNWVDSGATIVGGCCETGPAHIAEIARRLNGDGHRITAV